MTPLEKRLQQVIEKKADAHYLDRLGDDQARHSYLTGASLLAPLLVKLHEAMEFSVNAAENLYKPDKPLEKDLGPMFYFTLTYEGDLELIEKTKRARASLSSFEKFLEGGGDE
jgi:hypothetical protein